MSDFTRPLVCLPAGIVIELVNASTQRKIEVDPVDGHLTSARGFHEGDSLVMYVGVPLTETAFTVKVDGQKNVSELAEWVPTEETPDITWSQIKISVMRNKDWQKRSTGPCYTRYPDNQIRLISIDSEKGRMRMIEISIVAHANRFFLVTQASHEADLGWWKEEDDGDYILRSSYFESGGREWPQLLEYLEDIGLSLPTFEEIEPTFLATGTTQTDDLATDELRVVWYNVASGLGMGTAKDGTNVRLHRNHLQQATTNGLPFVLPGQKVKAGRIQPVPPQPGRPTAFTQEALQISVVS